MGRHPKKKSMGLTDLELQVMNIVWNKQETTVSEVLTELSQTKKLAYTTVATIFKVLESKKYLKSEKQDNLLIHSSLIARETYQYWYMSNNLSTIFESPKALVAKLIEETDLSSREIEKIKQVLVNKEF